ncbi:agmatine deiminase family protein [Pirellulaceae bacterium]|nr:agmatine deiminase family protein [Pirellulaceae bacterium]
MEKTYRFVVGITMTAIGIYLLLAPKPPIALIPGEFEQQEALLVAYEKQPSNQAYGEIHEKQRLTLIDIIVECYTSVDIKLLVSDDESYQSAKTHLAARNVELDNIEFIHQPFDSMWMRDYCPIQLNTASGNREWLDFDYYMPGDSWINEQGIRQDRADDDNVISRLAEIEGVPVRSVDIALHGGAMLSNGGNILLVSKAVFDWNEERHQLSPEQTKARFTKTFPNFHIEYVMPLAGEPTQHLDMFLVFTSRNTVVVGSYAIRMDYINHMRLNSVARQLAQLTVNGKPLIVERIDMPPHGRNNFGGSYTNVVFANGTLLLPDYKIDSAGLAKATTLYNRLLPNWNIRTIDSTHLIVMEGALHCVTGNIPAVE